MWTVLWQDAENDHADRWERFSTLEDVAEFLEDDLQYYDSSDVMILPSTSSEMDKDTFLIHYHSLMAIPNHDQ